MSRTCCAVLLLAAVVGCGRQFEKKAAVVHSDSPKSAPGNVVSGFDPAGEGLQPVQQAEPARQDPKAPPVEKVARKIKYAADIRLVTDDFAKSETQLTALIEQSDGFVSFADVATSPGQPRRGTWKARVPVAKFDTFCKSVAKVGDVERKNIHSEDVTAQFYDLENHIKNQKAQEEALRELLKRQTDKMENLLAVQRELSSVRDSIERSEGALRLLANLADLTTVTIHIQERQKFVPDKGPDAAEQPTFTARVRFVFGESWDSLVSLVQSLALAVVGIIPWLPVIGIFVGCVLVYHRRSRKPAALAPVPTPPASS